MKEFWDDIIDKRNSKLRDSDWTQIPDSPLTAEKKAEWAAYRQALRDITKEKIGSDENGHPVITFPTKPQCVKDVELNFAPLTKDFQRNYIIPSWNPPIK